MYLGATNPFSFSGALTVGNIAQTIGLSNWQFSPYAYAPDLSLLYDAEAAYNDIVSKMPNLRTMDKTTLKGILAQARPSNTMRNVLGSFTVPWAQLGSAESGADYGPIQVQIVNYADGLIGGRYGFPEPYGWTTAGSEGSSFIDFGTDWQQAIGMSGDKVGVVSGAGLINPTMVYWSPDYGMWTPISNKKVDRSTELIGAIIMGGLLGIGAYAAATVAATSAASASAATSSTAAATAPSAITVTSAAPMTIDGVSFSASEVAGLQAEVAAGNYSSLTAAAHAIYGPDFAVAAAGTTQAVAPIVVTSTLPAAPSIVPAAIAAVAPAAVISAVGPTAPIGTQTTPPIQVTYQPPPPPSSPTPAQVATAVTVASTPVVIGATGAQVLPEIQITAKPAYQAPPEPTVAGAAALVPLMTAPQYLPAPVMVTALPAPLAPTPPMVQIAETPTNVTPTSLPGIGDLLHTTSSALTVASQISRLTAPASSPGATSTRTLAPTSPGGTTMFTNPRPATSGGSAPGGGAFTWGSFPPWMLPGTPEVPASEQVGAPSFAEEVVNQFKNKPWLWLLVIGAVAYGMSGEEKRKEL